VDAVNVGGIQVVVGRMGRRSQQRQYAVGERVHHPVAHHPCLAVPELAAQVVQPGPGAAVECGRIELGWLPGGEIGSQSRRDLCLVDDRAESPGQRGPRISSFLVQGEVQFGQFLVPALVPVGPLPPRFLVPYGMAAKDQLADLFPPVPQVVALTRFGDDDHVEVGVVIGGALRERAVNDHRAHGSVGCRPGRRSLSHLFSRNGHQHYPSVRLTR
jgi:hypothetical protein